MEIEMYDVVRLLGSQVVKYDLEDFNLKKGQIGVVVEVYKGEYLVEIEVNDFTLYALIKNHNLDKVKL